MSPHASGATGATGADPVDRSLVGDARLTTIRNLLAKAEATTFPAEAEAFTAKATELMTRHRIDEAMVWARDDRRTEVPAEVRIVVHRPFTAQKAVLVGTVAEVFGCQAVRLGDSRDGQGETVSVIGFPTDLTLVETLVTSLFLQLTSAMTAPGTRRGSTASQVASWRRSFIMGFTATVGERLAADHREAVRHESSADAAPTGGETAAAGPGDSTATPSVALVLRDRDRAVRDDLRQRYPRLRTSRVSVGTSAAGRAAGHSAGRTADLGARRIGNRGRLGPGR